MINEIRLRLVTGEDVYYGVCGDYLKEEAVLAEIKKKPYIKVTDDDGIRLTIYPNKVVGCYIINPKNII